MRKILTFFVSFLSLCAISCTEKEELVIQNTVPVFGRVEAVMDGYKFAFSATISIDNPNNPYYVYGFEVSFSADMADATVVAGKGLGNDGAFTGTYDLVGWKGGDVLYYRAFISRKEGETPLYSETFKVDVPKREYESLKFTSEGKSTIKLENKDGNNPLLYYSYDEFKWTQWDYSELEFTKDRPVYINGDNPKGFSKSSSQYSNFSLSGSPVGCSGSVMTLIDRKNTVDAIPSDWCFTMLFYKCSLLESAPAIPARTLAKSCYSYMFSGTGLAQSPSLPATVMADNCYNGMFSGCKSLKRAEHLPAMNLAPWCYSYMFDSCTSLDYEYDLPAEKLEEACYLAMFRNCTSIVKSVTIRATEIAPKCYRRMFKNCESLIVAPNLSAAVLTEDCYSEMFMGCKKLNLVHCDAIDISAKDCTNNWLSGVASTGTFVKAPCMNDWTRGVSGIPEGWNVENSDGSEVVIVKKYLTFTSEGTTTISLENNGGNAPKLYYSYDKSNWVEWDYSSLEFTSVKPLYLCGDNPDGFSHSSEVNSAFIASGWSGFSCEGDIMSLINPIEDVLSIPSEYCFIDLFSNCSNLIKAPELPATTLADHCYAWMFWGCSSLKTAPDLPATDLARGCYQKMFYGCTSLNSVMCLATDISAEDCTKEWLSGVASTGTFVKAPGMNDWTRGVSGIPEGWIVENSDGSEEKKVSNYLTLSSEGTSAISLENNGGNAPKLYYSYDKTKWEEWDYSSLEFTSVKPLYLCGDNPDGFSYSSARYSAFIASGSSFSCEGDIMSLLNPIDDVLAMPCRYCYYALFRNCSNLTIGPDLPATTLSSSCYDYMFYGCSSLQEAPQLPATTLSFSCYGSMFYGCSSLQIAPELPATTLADLCYAWMFWGCTSLQTAPALPATVLAGRCYGSMFRGCTSLQTAPELPATTLADWCYESMFQDCTSLQTAPALPATVLAERCYYEMFRGCTSLQTAPELPATTLADMCYESMFWGCRSLNSVNCFATDISAEYCTWCWLSGVASTGTFVKAKGMNDWTRGSSGIPEGWTVSEK